MPIAWKISILAASLVIASTLTLFFLVRGAVERAVVNREQATLNRVTSLAAREFVSEIDRGVADARVVSSSPSIAGTVEALTKDKSDYGGDATAAQWKDRVERYFRALMIANPTYLQVRIIGVADNGREIVRLEKTQAGIIRTPEGALQQKGERPYFKSTLAQRPGSVYVSPIELNQEHGKVEVPHRPVVRVGSVVTDNDANVFGIVVINIDFSQVLKRMQSISADPLTLYMTTAAGDYLVAPDPAKTFGFDLGQRSVIQNDMPWLTDRLRADARLEEAHEYRTGSILTRVVRVQAGDGKGKQTWLIVGSLDLEVAAADFMSFRDLLVAAAALLIALGTLCGIYFAKRISAPLRGLAAALRNVGDGSFAVELPTAGGSAELLDVENAFVRMRDAVQSREQRLRDAQARDEAIVDGAVNPIITIDERGTILHVNRSTRTLFGYEPGELEGQNVSILMPEPYRDAHDGYLKRYLAAGEARIIGKGREVHAKCKDGRVLPVELGVSEVRLASGRTFVGTLTDLSEIKKLEKIRLEKIEGALELERMKGEFVATVSHELRTPLTSIKGSLALLAGERLGALPGKAKAMIEIAQGNSERLARIINDILDIEKIKAGHMTFTLQKVDVAKLLKDAAEANAAYAAQFGVKIGIAPVADELTVEADPDRVAQALTNLISNAVKYSPKGGTVTLSAHRSSDKDLVRINVADEGPGIPKEFQNQVFARFAQADSTDARKKGGTGLGLSITKAIVEAHKGEIGYSTSEGKGTIFYMDLPVGGSVPKGEAAASAPRILVCEDDPDIALLLRIIVEDAGYSAHVCATAKEAKSVLRAGEFSAMTLDLTLPDADGLSLLRDLRRDPKGAALPVIVVSGAASEGKKRLKGGAFSFVDWLDKPIQVDELHACLKRVLDGSGARPLQMLHVEDDKDHRAIVADVVGTSGEITYAGSVEEATELLRARQFDVVILDLVLPDGPGERLLPVLNSLQSKSAPAVLVYSIKELPATLAPYVEASLIKSRSDAVLLRMQIQKLVKQGAQKAGAGHFFSSGTANRWI